MATATLSLFSYRMTSGMRMIQPRRARTAMRMQLQTGEVRNNAYSTGSGIPM